METYITNKNTFYFEVKVPINLDLLSECIVHESQEAMYDYVCETNKLTMDDVEGADLSIVEYEGETHCLDNRGCGSQIDGDIETFLNDFFM